MLTVAIFLLLAAALGGVVMAARIFKGALPPMLLSWTVTSTRLWSAAINSRTASLASAAVACASAL